MAYPYSEAQEQLPETTAAGLHRRSVLKMVGAAAAVSTLPFVSARAAAPYTLRVTTISAARGAVQAVADRFIAKYPGSNVNLAAADVDQLQTSTRVALSSGTAADVLNTWVGNGNPLTIGQLAPGGFLEDLSSQPLASKLPKSVDPVTRIGGNLLIMPISLSFIGAVFNTKLFSSLGLKPAKTWDEFLAICQKIKAAGVVPIAAGNGTIWVNQLFTYSLVPSLVYADNPNFNADRRVGKVKFAGSAWRQALDRILELQKGGFLSDNPNGTSFDEQLQLVASGKAAMAFATSSAFGNVFKYSGTRDFSMMPVPGTNDPAKLWIAASPSTGFSINAKAKNREAAVAFLNFMSEPEAVAAYSEAGQLATVLPSAPVPAVDKLYEHMMPLFKAGKSTIFMDQTWPNARVQQVHNSGIQELLAGRITADALLKRMDEAYDS